MEERGGSSVVEVFRGGWRWWREGAGGCVGEPYGPGGGAGFVGVGAGAGGGLVVVEIVEEEAAGGMGWFIVFVGVFKVGVVLMGDLGGDSVLRFHHLIGATLVLTVISGTVRIVLVFYVVVVFGIGVRVYSKRR